MAVIQGDFLGGHRFTPGVAQPVIQRFSNGEAYRLPDHLLQLGAGGQALSGPVLRQMESCFGVSFSDVRVHISSQATSMGARALTYGSNLYFAPGQFNPSTSQGQRLLGHELTHVVQQRSGRVRNPFGSGIAVVRDFNLEAEADRMGHRAAAHRVSASSSAGHAIPVATIQRSSAPVASGRGLVPGSRASHRAQPSNAGRPQLANGIDSANRASAVVQRLVAWEPGPQVYAPRSVRKFAHASYTAAKYQAGLRLLLGGNPQIATGQPLETRLRNAGVDHVHRQTIWQQFRDENNVYVYNANYQLQNANPARTQPIMEPKDMGDATGVVPGAMVFAAACVIQSLASLGRAVPGGVGAGTNQQHHDYSVARGLDYRTDSDYLKLYIEHYNLNLVHSGLVPWAAVPWAALGGAGDYLATTYNAAPAPAAVGHMVGVRVQLLPNNTFATNVMDQQNLTAPTLNAGNGFAKYIFRV